MNIDRNSKILQSYNRSFVVDLVLVKLRFSILVQTYVRVPKICDELLDC